MAVSTGTYDFEGRNLRDFLSKSRKLDPAKNSETFHSRKFILAKYSKIGYSRKLIPVNERIFIKFFELDWTFFFEIFAVN